MRHERLSLLFAALLLLGTCGSYAQNEKTVLSVAADTVASDAKAPDRAPGIDVLEFQTEEFEQKAGDLFRQAFSDLFVTERGPRTLTIKGPGERRWEASRVVSDLGWLVHPSQVIVHAVPLPTGYTDYEPTLRRVLSALVPGLRFSIEGPGRQGGAAMLFLVGTPAQVHQAEEVAAEIEQWRPLSPALKLLPLRGDYEKYQETLTRLLRQATPNLQYSVSQQGEAYVLVAVGTPAEYDLAERAIEQARQLGDLHVLPPQIQIEALFVELSPEDLHRIGIQWPGSRAPTDIDSQGIWFGNLRADAGGFGGEARIRALIQSGKAHLLAVSNLTVESGREATIFSGDKVPLLPLAGTNQPAPPDVGIRLTVQPSVAAGQSEPINLRLDARATTLVSLVRSAHGAVPLVNHRGAATVLRTDPEENTVIGGLMSDEELRAVDRIPILGDLPIIGPVFRYRRAIHRHRELLLLVRASVVEDRSPARRPTADREKR
jgi:hypothetical protein